MTAADVYRALWRRKLFIGAMTAALVLLTLLISLQQTPIYEANTLVRIQQQSSGSGQAFDSIQAAQRLTQTYAEIVKSGALSGRVERLLRPRDPRIDVSRKALSAEPVQDLELLTISARDPSPRRAMLIANAVPVALRAFIRETGTMRDSVVAVAPAGPPRSPVSPNIPVYLVLALLLGLLLNSCLALLLELLADRIPDPDELEEALGVPVLATLPVLKVERPARAGADGRVSTGENEEIEVRPSAEGSSLA